MQITVVYAHPSPHSLSNEVFAAVCASLSPRHQVHALDLYADGFSPAMTEAERRAYETDSPILDPLVAKYVEAVRASEAIIFVFPTWWSGMPAILKGWLERVLVPGVAFGFNKRGKIRPELRHIRLIAGVTHYRSSRRRVLWHTDPGKRTIRRALRGTTGLRARVRWLGIYSSRSITEADRSAFIQQVTEEFSAW